MNPINGTIPPNNTATAVTPVSGSATILPLTVELSRGQLQVQIQGQQYVLQTDGDIQQLKAVVQQSYVTALEIQRPLPEVLQGQTTSQLLVLAKSIQIRLPDALTQLASQNGIPFQLLQQLASRPQGYPLPPVTVDKADIRFAGGVVVTIPQDVKLPTGQYLAKVVAQNNGLQLQLQPVVSQTAVTLQPASQFKFSMDGVLEQPPRLLNKPDIGAIFTQWFKAMEQIAVPQNREQGSSPQAATATSSNIPIKLADTGALPKNPALSTSNNTADVAKSLLGKEILATKLAATTGEQAVSKADIKSALNPPATTENPGSGTKLPPQAILTFNYLQRAFNKLGAVPRTELHTMEVRQNVASELLKLLPALQPKSMGSLALPEVLQAELTAQLAFQPAAPVTTPNATQADAVSTLLQLLIGVKAFSQQLHVSPKLRQYLQSLQSRSGIGAALLQTLQENDALEHVNRMVQGIRLYQQASNVDGGNQTWYATIPYYLDQRQEQLEAKYEQSAANSQEPNKRQQWQLQLKFNLSSGALLAKAQMQEHGVSLHFIGSSQLLIDKVSSNVEMLGKKLTQLGLAPSEISAHVAPVPATLLPGDHYLVQLKA
ncbi:hypothetical protein [Shewanella dokdonensis]|nr:hypothetical protein [Shewanella dokdonensis]MCL1073911.1 hypothetical protein [Shewanella dokdonensis]